MVTAVVNGKLELVRIHIEPQMLRAAIVRCSKTSSSQP